MEEDVVFKDLFSGLFIIFIVFCVLFVFLREFVLVLAKLN